jgi:hypothetical protein
MVKDVLDCAGAVLADCAGAVLADCAGAVLVDVVGCAAEHPATAIAAASTAVTRAGVVRICMVVLNSVDELAKGWQVVRKSGMSVIYGKRSLGQISQRRRIPANYYTMSLVHAASDLSARPTTV